MDDFDEILDPSLLDEIGPWSERKHGIMQDYAGVYSYIMSRARKQVRTFRHDYVDGFASAGVNRRRNTNDIVKGTALRSLDIEPPFDAYVFVELDPKKTTTLRTFASRRPNVEIINDNSNVVLPRDVFPRYSFKNYHRAFCVLDPYTHKNLDWSTIAAAGKTQSIDVLLHFPTMPMNRGALRRDGEVSHDEAAWMTRFWGDRSWEDAAYVERDGLLAGLPREKATDLEFATAFCNRLKGVAGFKGTSKPIPMKNTKGALMYYLIFALPHDSAIKAANSVAKYFIEYPMAVSRPKQSAAEWRNVG